MIAIELSIAAVEVVIALVLVVAFHILEKRLSEINKQYIYFTIWHERIVNYLTRKLMDEQPDS